MIRSLPPAASAALMLAVSLAAVAGCQLDDAAPIPRLTLDEVAAAPAPVDAFIDPTGVRWTYAGEVERAGAAPLLDDTEVAAPDDGAASLSLVFASGREYVTDDSLATLADRYFPGTNEELAPVPVHRGVINGADDRVQIDTPINLTAPFTRVVRLTNDVGVCSGALFGPRHVLTAGHCLHSGKRSGHHYGPTSATPAQVCSSGAACQPFGVGNELARIVSSAWRSGITYSYSEDWAILITDARLGDATGWFGFGPTAKDTLKDLTVTTFGYPIDKPAATLWGHSCSVGIVLPRRFRFECDISFGQSGSGIWAGNQLRGIVSNEVSNGNRAVRLEEDIDRAMRNARANFP